MLRQGDRGAEVRALQQFLADNGFDPGPIDGIFGPLTAAAVRAFQSANVDVNGDPLEPDGIVGPLTQGAIDAITNPPADVPGDGDADGGDAGGGDDAPPASSSSGGGIFDPPVVFDNSTDIPLTIPDGGTLVRVTDPAGSDAEVLNFLVFDAFGVSVAYEIGDNATLQDTFGSFTFENVITVGQAGFDEAGILEIGFIDEIIGQDESIGSLLERELRLLGFEDIPAWIRGDTEAMSILMVAAREGWSPGRTSNELSETDAFNTRFPSFAALQEQLGGNVGVLDTIDTYVNLETSYRAMLRRFRGPTTDTSNEYLAQLIEIGWDPNEVQPVLQAERTLRDNPNALDELNQLMAFNGLDAVDEIGFIDIMEGNAPFDVFEVLNDAFRAEALARQGIDIDTAFASSLGSGTSTDVVSPEAFAPIAQQIASTVARNFPALQNQLFGLERDDIVAAMFNETSPTGRSSSEISEILLRLQREAQASAGGLGSGTGFIDQNDRLRIQGLGGL